MIFNDFSVAEVKKPNGRFTWDQSARAGAARKRMRGKAQILIKSLPLHGWVVLYGGRQAQGRGANDPTVAIDLVLKQKTSGQILLVEVKYSHNGPATALAAAAADVSKLTNLLKTDRPAWLNQGASRVFGRPLPNNCRVGSLGCGLAHWCLRVPRQSDLSGSFKSPEAAPKRRGGGENNRDPVVRAASFAPRPGHRPGCGWCLPGPRCRVGGRFFVFFILGFELSGMSLRFLE